MQINNFIAKILPGLRGFTKVNLFRMRQFYETYCHDEIISPLVRQLPWTHNLIILSQSKSREERLFYVNQAIREQWSKRELERQLKAALFERAMLHPQKSSKILTELRPEAISIFKDAYMVEFLDLPDGHQVGNRDFAIDLLFFHRGLNCLVAFELKVGRFEPEYLGKLSFYLEALDQNVKKQHENPAIGILLCANKDDEVVEFALNRTLSPAVIAEYKTQLPDKKLLREKLHEFFLQNEQP